MVHSPHPSATPAHDLRADDTARRWLIGFARQYLIDCDPMKLDPGSPGDCWPPFPHEALEDMPWVTTHGEIFVERAAHSPDAPITSIMDGLAHLWAVHQLHAAGNPLAPVVVYSSTTRDALEQIFSAVIALNTARDSAKHISDGNLMKLLDANNTQEQHQGTTPGQRKAQLQEQKP